MSNQNDVNVRKVSFGIVTSVVEDGVFLNDALNNTLVKYQYLDKQKRGYITYLCTGVIERLIEMDAVISSYSSTKINKLNPNIKNIIYHILILKNHLFFSVNRQNLQLFLMILTQSKV